MAMSYNTLIAAKGTSGSIANWVRYSLLDIPPIVDEAQALIYGLLRCREMRSLYTFSMPVGASELALPANFLDPIGRIFFPSINLSCIHTHENPVALRQNFTENNGALGTNALTTTNGNFAVNVNLAGHGLNQGSIFVIAGATAFNGVTLNGAFPVTAIVDANNFTVDTTVLGTAPSGSGAGGGAAMTYVSDSLVQGMPTIWSIWDELIHFDCSFVQQLQGQLLYFRSLPLLSGTNQANFLTNRYPQLMRTACVAAAADFMKDTEEYNKGVARLTQLVQSIGIENDMMYRGAEIYTDTP